MYEFKAISQQKFFDVTACLLQKTNNKYKVKKTNCEMLMPAKISLNLPRQKKKTKTGLAGLVLAYQFFVVTNINMSKT